MRNLTVCYLLSLILFLPGCSKKPTNESIDNFWIIEEWTVNYPNMEKGACPGNEVVNIFPPGTHSVNLTAGERYYFNLTIGNGSSYEISYVESPGVDITSSTLICSLGPGEGPFPAENDSGLSGQAESVIISMRNGYPRLIGVLFSTVNTSINLTLPSTSYFN